MSSGLLFKDVVYSPPAELPHKPLFCESNATELFQSKAKSKAAKCLQLALDAFPPVQGIDSAKSTHWTLAPSSAVLSGDQCQFEFVI